MVLKDFRRWAYEAVEWSADYLENVREWPVRAQVEPGEIFRQLAGEPPMRGESIEAIFADPRLHHHAGDHALAAPALLRVFPRECQPPVGATIRV
jgi:aromatic-L-amino-acid decarboxylase